MKDSSKRLGIIVGLIFTGAIIFAIVYSSIAAGTNNSNYTHRTPKTNQVEQQYTGTKMITLKQTIDYDTKTINDETLEYGKTEIRTNGAAGEKTLTYEVVYENGKEKERELVKEEVTKQPITKVIANGTKIIWHCIDTTSYNKNPYDDNYCISSTGEARYVNDSRAKALEPSYRPSKRGAARYNF